ncbi:MAG TPA: hypothetical protein VJT31_17035, partial [Rugosimonospora sp.]|nr:hypothetical protein [Rugosimonospora sp.]
LAALSGGPPPPRRDAAWRWRLPPAGGTAVERIPPDEIRRLGTAAERTIREAGQHVSASGRAVGERVLRDALLDHVPIVVEAAGQRVEVPQRLVQAVLRMGFLGPGTGGAAGAPVVVRTAPGWVGLAGGYGTAWRRSADPLAVRPARHHPNV